MVLGIDVSTYFEELEAGAKYFLDGKEIEPLDEFISNGVSYMRIRVWNNPFDEEGNPYLGGTNDLATCVKLAKLAKEKGYKFIIDFHYSDFWADPGKQFAPKAWKDLSFEEVKNELGKFTKEALQTLKDGGIDVEYVQIGNEITNGMCWPFGKLDETISPRGNYENLSILLKEGCKAAKEVYPNIKTIIHLERSYDIAIYNEYFENIIKNGVEFDVIGMSYYPYWHGTFEQLFANVENCKKNFNKEIMIMELGFGFTLEDYLLTNNGTTQLVINEKNLETLTKSLPHPISPEGQKLFVRDFLKLAKEHEISGVVYWEPIWTPQGEKICWASTHGQKYINELGKSTRNEWSNQCLFDYEGHALPAFKEFKN